MVLAEHFLNPHGLQNGLKVPDHRAMGDMTCKCPKVPTGLPFAPKVQSKNPPDLPADMVGSAEEMKTPGEDLELPPGA